MYLSIAWLMISWWPHIGMHVHNAPDNLQGLIYIDYLFHVPLMIAGAVLAYCFFLWCASGHGAPYLKDKRGVAANALS